mgnify:CR=1 FL=1
MPRIQKARVDLAALNETLEFVRDIKNWLFTFSQECDIADEAKAKLHEKIDELAQKIAHIQPKAGHIEIDASLVREAENALRDLKNWLYTFSELYDLATEARETLHQKFDELSKKIAHIEVKAV